MYKSKLAPSMEGEGSHDILPLAKDCWQLMAGRRGHFLHVP